MVHFVSDTRDTSQLPVIHLGYGCATLVAFSFSQPFEVEDEKEIVVGDIATVTVQLLCAS